MEEYTINLPGFISDVSISELLEEFDAFRGFDSQEVMQV